MVACCEWAKAGNPKQKSNMELGSTLGEMAEAADVSVKTIQQAKAAHAAGLGDQVRDGEEWTNPLLFFALDCYRVTFLLAKAG